MLVKRGLSEFVKTVLEKVFTIHDVANPNFLFVSFKSYSTVIGITLYRRSTLIRYRIHISLNKRRVTALENVRPSQS